MHTELLAHVVAGYPSMSASLQIAKVFATHGVGALELQFPFSDPVADGVHIERACHHALDNGFTVSDGFHLAEQIIKETGVPLYIMSYATIPYRMGIDRFTRSASACGATGLIVPDLPIAHDEGLYASCDAASLHSVAVALLDDNEERLEALCAIPHAMVYAMLRRGITGAHTAISAIHRPALSRLTAAGKRVMVGFGVRNAQHIHSLAGVAEYIVVGSHFVRIITEQQNTGDMLNTLARATTELTDALSSSPAT